MKKNHQKDMQVATVHKWQKALDNSLKTVRFLWRHAIVLSMLGMMIKIVDLQTANWKNIFISLVIAALVDFFKMKIKHSNHYNGTNNRIFKIDDNWNMNPAKMGSAAWNIDPCAPGSSAYYSRQNNSRYS